MISLYYQKKLKNQISKLKSMDKWNIEVGKIKD